MPLQRAQCVTIAKKELLIKLLHFAALNNSRPWIYPQYPMVSYATGSTQGL